MFRIIQNLFSSNPANVQIGEILFNIFINDLLVELEKTGLGATIGLIQIPVLGFADDIVLISDDPRKLQKLLDICEAWSIKNRMSFNTDKCKVMILNGPSKDFIFKLNNRGAKKKQFRGSGIPP